MIENIFFILDCLARYFEIEELNEKNFYYCDKCESQQRSTKRFWINALPNVSFYFY